MNAKLKECTSDEKVAYLIKPILKVIQDAGGSLERNEIISRISDLDEQIAEFAEIVKTSRKSGNTYKEFNFKFNFAIKDLSFLGFLGFKRGNPIITLTEKGLNTDINSLNVENDIMIPSKKFWLELGEKNKNKKRKKLMTIEDDVNESMSDSYSSNDFKEKLLNSIKKMNPRKFEAFSRALLTKMGVRFESKNIQISHDGGIDGYGYHCDNNDFRTTRVVIQCKRYNAGTVGEPEINKFLGAMNKFKADYGVFITNSRYTKEARDASKAGTPITLIDGNDLVELVIKFQLYITPITSYILDDFYYNN